MTTLKTSIHEPQYIFIQFCHKYFNAHVNVPHSLHPMNMTHTIPFSGLISLGKYTWVNSLFYILIPHRSKLLSYSQDSLNQVHLGAEQQRQRWKGFVKRKAVLIWEHRGTEWGLGCGVRAGTRSEGWDVEWGLGHGVRAGIQRSEGWDIEWGLGRQLCCPLLGESGHVLHPSDIFLRVRGGERLDTLLRPFEALTHVKALWKGRKRQCLASVHGKPELWAVSTGKPRMLAFGMHVEAVWSENTNP